LILPPRAHLLVFQPLAQGTKAQWLVNADLPHSFTYTPDAARATSTLQRV